MVERAGPHAVQGGERGTARRRELLQEEEGDCKMKREGLQDEEGGLQDEEGGTAR